MLSRPNELNFGVCTSKKLKFGQTITHNYLFLIYSMRTVLGERFAFFWLFFWVNRFTENITDAERRQNDLLFNKYRSKSDSFLRCTRR